MAKDHKTIKRVFGSLINNATAIDGAKFSPWWVGVIMFVIGILLPIVPLFVTSATTKGTSFMSSYEYGLGLDKTFGTAINEIEGTLTFNNSTKEIEYASNAIAGVESNMIGNYVSVAGDCKDQYELRIYYSELTDVDEISRFVTNTESISYLKGSTTIKGNTEGDAYIPTTIFFFKNTFYMEIYGSNSTEQKAIMSFRSDLKWFDYEGSDLKAYFCGQSFDKNNKDNRIAALNNLKDFINTTYKTRKNETMWLGSLIYLGVYTGLNLLMGLMCFLMSRGKNNPNNYLTFWQCIKIDMWCSLAPGILGLVGGFIFAKNAVLIYVMLVAMRIMWLTTKELRPQY